MRFFFKQRITKTSPAFLMITFFFTNFPIKIFMGSGFRQSMIALAVNSFLSHNALVTCHSAAEIYESQLISDFLVLIVTHMLFCIQSTARFYKHIMNLL